MLVNSEKLIVNLLIHIDAINYFWSILNIITFEISNSLVLIGKVNSYLFIKKWIKIVVNLITYFERRFKKITKIYKIWIS